MSKLIPQGDSRQCWAGGRGTNKTQPTSESGCKVSRNDMNTTSLVLYRLFTKICGKFEERKASRNLEMAYLLMLFHSTVQNRAYTQLYVFIIINEFFKERIRLSFKRV